MGATRPAVSVYLFWNAITRFGVEREATFLVRLA